MGLAFLMEFDRTAGLAHHLGVGGIDARLQMAGEGRRHGDLIDRLVAIQIEAGK